MSLFLVRHAIINLSVETYCVEKEGENIMQHEELFCCHSAEWVEEVRKAVEGDR